MVRRPRSPSLLVLYLVLTTGACTEPEEIPSPTARAEASRTELRAAELERAHREAPGWVKVFDPMRAWNGFTLDFFQRTIPILIDMNGEIVHSWPQARVRARLRLLPNGNLLAIGLAQSIVEYDWGGALVWEYPLGGEYAHHDVVRLANGNTLMIVGRRGEPTDSLVEVDREGREVWRWESALYLSEHFGDVADDARDITHINSVQVLPPNPLFEGGDDRFRPGNVLISARNLNAVFLIDRATNAVVWKYLSGLDRQHEAMMIGPDLPGHGDLLIFNNGAKDRYTYRQSSIVELNPSSLEVVWEYRAEGFFSTIVGVQQPLPNGNVLIGSSLGRRNFEVTRSGEIVWQWVPPFKTKRPARYPYDFTPQLRELGARSETPVVPIAGYRHLDPLVYRFARDRYREERQFEDRKRIVLKMKSACRKLILPVGARIALTFGIDRFRITQSGASDYEADFSATLRVMESGTESMVMNSVVDLEGRAWRSHRWELDDLALQTVELCLDEPVVRSGEIEIANSDSYWEHPRVTGSADREARRWSKEVSREKLTPAELEVRQEHLKTLGYID